MGEPIYYRMSVVFTDKDLKQMGNWSKIFEEQGMEVSIKMIEKPKEITKNKYIDADIMYQYTAGV